MASAVDLTLLSFVFILTNVRSIEGNVALGKSATQSSTASQQLGAQLAIDGNANGNSTSLSCSQTQLENNPWLLIDLGESHQISNLMITNRADCCWNALRNVDVRVGDNNDGSFQSNPMCKQSPGGFLPGENITIWCDQPLDGQFVSIQIISDDGQADQLTLCEVQVYEFAKVRLEYGGQYGSFGRIEIYDGHEWGAVCDTLSSETNELVCSLLGYTPEVVKYLHIDESREPARWKTLSCSGGETSIDECEKVTHGNASCQVATLDCDPVAELALVRQKSHDGYTFTLDKESAAVCEAFDVGASKASYKDLQNAYSQGFEFCRAGWAISEGCQAYGVVQTPTPGCDYKGVFKWSSGDACKYEYDVFCKVLGDRLTRKRCPEGWYYIDYGQAFSKEIDHCYKVVDIGSTAIGSLEEGDTHCQGFGGVIDSHLASIGNQKEQDAVLGYLLRANKNHQNVMIGLVAKEGKWGWLDDSPDVFSPPMMDINDFTRLGLAAYVNTNMSTSWKIEEHWKSRVILCKGRPTHGVRLTTETTLITKGESITFNIEFTALANYPFNNLSMYISCGPFRKEVTGMMSKFGYFGSNIFKTEFTITPEHTGAYYPALILNTPRGEEIQYAERPVVVLKDISESMVLRASVDAFQNKPGLAIFHLEYNVDPLDPNALYGVVCHFDFGDGNSLRKELKEESNWNMVANHTYAPDYLGAQEVSVLCANKISSSRSNTTFSLIQPIENVNIGSNSLFHSVEDDIRLEVTCERGSHVTYSIYYGNGSKEVIPLSGLLCRDEKIERVIKYAATGNYTIVVDAENRFSSFTTRKTLFVQNPVRQLEMTVDYPSEGHALFHVKYDGDLKKMPSNVFVLWSFPNQNEITAYAGPLSEIGSYDFLKTFKLENYGQFEVQAIFSNLVSSQVVTANVSIEQHIDGLRISPVSSIGTQGNPLNVTVALSKGSRVGFEVLFGDGTRETKQLQDFALFIPRLLEFSHVYNNTGHYTIQVHASNQFSSISMSQDVVIQEPVMSVHASPMFARTDSPVTVTVTVGLDKAAKVSIAFGDGASIENMGVDSDTTSSLTLNKQHKYTTAGTYSVFVSASNGLIFANGTVHGIVVQEPITELGFSCTEIAHYPGGVVECEIWNKADAVPTDVFCEWTYSGRKSIKSFIGTPLVKGEMHKQSFYVTGEDSDFATTTVNCSNLISSSPGYTAITRLLETVNGLSIYASPMTASTRESVVFRGTLFNGTGANLSIDFGDGTPLQIINMSLTTNEFMTEHTFSSPGTYTISVVAANSCPDVTSKIHGLVIQEPIKQLNVTCGDSAKLPWDIVDCEIWTEVPTPPTDVFCEWAFSNNELKTSFMGTISGENKRHRQSFIVEHGDMGFVPLTVSCSNLVSSLKTNTTKVYVKQNIKAFVVTVSPMVARTNGTVVLTVASLPVTGANCMIDFGDGTIIEESVPDKISNTTTIRQSFITKHMYHEAGTFDIMVKAENGLSTANSTVRGVLVQHPLRNFTMTTNSPVKLNSNATFKLLINEGGVFPTDLSCEFDYGDGTPPKHVEVQKLPTPYANFNHKHVYGFSNIGAKTVRVTCSNVVSRYALTQQIHIEEVISELVIVPSVWNLKRSEGVEFTVTAISGSNVTVLIKYGDGSVDTSTKQRISGANNHVTFSHVYESTGNYTVFVTAENLVSSSSFVLEHHLVVQEPIKALNISCNKSVMIQSLVECEVMTLVFPAPNNVLCKWVYSSREPVLSFFETLKQSGRKYTQLFQVEKSDIGEVSITMNCSNLVSSSEVHTAELKVVQPPEESLCLPPTVLFKGAGHNSFADPFRNLRSRCLPLKIEVEPNGTCEHFDVYSFTWTLEIYDAENDVFRRTNLPGMSGGGMNSSHVNIPELSLDVALYRVSVNVVVSNHDVTQTSDFYLQVTDSIIKAGIMGGSFVRASSQTPFTLNAEEGSFDPDVQSSDKTGMTFLWSCRKLPRQGVDGFINTGFSGKCSSAMIDKMKGGQFTLESHSLEAGVTYEFTVGVYKDIRKGTYKQTVEVIEDIPPSLVINCIHNCNQKVNPDLYVELQARCTNHCSPGMRWVWKAFIVDTVTNEFTRAAGLNITVDGDLVYIGDVTGGIHYKVLLDVISESAVGRKEYTFITNILPSGGNCYVEPKTGFAMFSSFKVVCSGWRDNDFGCDVEPLYRYYSRKKDSNTMNLLKEGGNEVFNLSLPLGSKKHNYSMEIIVMIIDKYAGNVTVPLEVQVLDPLTGKTDDEKNAIINTAADDIAKQLESDSQGACQNIFGLLGLLDSDTGISKTSASNVLNKLVGAMNRTYTPQNSIVSAMQSATALNAISQHTGGITTDSEVAVSTTMGKVAADVASLNATSQEEYDESFDGLRSMMLTVAVTNSTDINRDETVKRAAKAKMGAFTKAQNALSVTKLKNMPIGAPAFTLGDGDSPLTLKKDSPDKLKGGTMTNNLAEVNLPTDIELEGDFFSTQMASYKDNPFNYGSEATNSTDQPSSAITSFEMLGADGERLQRVSNEKGIELSITPKQMDNPILIARPLPSGNQSMCYHMVSKNNKHSVFQIYVKPTTNVSFNLYVKLGARPSPTDYDLMTAVPKRRTDLPTDDDLQYTLSIPATNVIDDQKYYIGIEQVGDATNLRSDSVDNDLNGNGLESSTPLQALNMTTEKGIGPSSRQETTTLRGRNRRDNRNPATKAPPHNNGTSNRTDWFVPYYIQFYELTCQRWDDVKQKWESDCKIDPDSSPKKVKFKSNLFGNFGAGLFVPPNSIDFSKVFDNLDEKLKENAPVLATIVVIIAVYFVLVWVCRRMDKKDGIRWTFNPLLDNLPDDNHGYKMTVFTSSHIKAGTKSKVFFVLSGQEGDSGLRVLDDGVRENFKRGSVDNFYVSTPNSIGSLVYLRIWHDNSGGLQRAWHLDKVIVTDIVSGKRYNFMCDKWLSKTKDDMKVDRIIPVADKERLKEAASFGKSARSNMADDHLLFSVVSRPVPSNFTRVQRLSCVLSIFFLTMIANAMWYKTDEETGGKASDRITVGPISFTMSQLYASVMSTLTILPANFIIIYIFRNSKRRTKKIQDIYVAKARGWRKLKKRKTNQKIFDNVWSTDCSEVLSEWDKYASVEVVPESGYTERWQRLKLSMLSWKRAKRVKKPSRQLPFWFIYISWILVFLSVVASAFFTMLYSFEWGGVKSTGWLTTFLLSVFENNLMISPLEVVVFAALFSLILKKPPDVANDTDDDVDIPVNNKVTANPMERNVPPPPLPDTSGDQEADIKAREILSMRKKREDVLTDAVKDILSHSFYLFLLLTIVYGMRDTSSYYMNEEMNNLFTSGTEYDDVATAADFWDWLENNMISNLYYEGLYNGFSVDASYDRKFVANGVTMRMTPVRLRQLRVNPKRCLMNLAVAAAGHIDTCYQDYSFDNEDTENITRPQDLIYDENPILDMTSSVMFRNSSELKAEAIWAQLAWYSGNGYVAVIPENFEDSVKYIQKLRNLDWIDRFTRVVFVEFTVFTMNVNLFTSIRLTYEFPTTGAAIVSKEVTSFNLYRYTGGAGVMSIFAEAMCMLYTLYFTIKEIAGVVTKRRAYFKKPWNVFNSMSCVFMWACMGMYTEKNMMTMRTVEDIFNNRGKYVSFDSLVLIDVFFMGFFACVVFITQIRFINILRFQRYIAIATKTARKAGSEATWFLSTLFIVFMAFLFLGVTWFCTECELFKNYWSSACFLLSLLTDYSSTEETMALALGPIYFFLFSFLAFWVMTGILMTIVQGAHLEALKEEDMRENDIGMADYFWGKVKDMVPFFNSQEEDIDDKIEDIKHVSSRGAKMTTMHERRHNLNEHQHKSSKYQV